MPDKISERFRLASAWRLAERLRDQLAASCERIEVAGSIRRHRSLVSDIELVLTPKFGGTPGMLFDNGDSYNLAWARCAQMQKHGTFGKAIRNGEKWRTYPAKLDDRAIKVDLFACDASAWPVVFAIRTGGAEFSKLCVTQRGDGGFLPNGHVVEVGTGQVFAGRVFDRETTPPQIMVPGTVVPMADEAAFVRFCCDQFVEPENRDAFATNQKGKLK